MIKWVIIEEVEVPKVVFALKDGCRGPEFSIASGMKIRRTRTCRKDVKIIL